MEAAPVLVWWATYLLLALVGLPLVARLLPGTPLRGAGLALPAALTVLLLPTYWLGQVAYGLPTVLVGVAVLLAVSLVARRRGDPVDRRAFAEVAAVFTVAFLFVLAVRMVDAGAVPGGGEKFLDFGILQSLLRAESLPPVDMWFAGERVVYYYGGHLLAASLATLTDTAGRYAYNLALAGAYAAAVAGVYDLAGTMAHARGWSRRRAGGLGAFTFGLASNLYVPAGLVATYFVPGWVEPIAAATGNAPSAVRVTTGTFSYWWASRVIPGAITEFPFFAYLNGDLHGHMTVTAFSLLAVGVCYAYYRTPAAEIRRRRLLAFAALPLVVGVVTLVNTWSLPMALGVTWLTLTFAPAHPQSLVTGRPLSKSPGSAVADELRRVALAAVLVVPVAIASLLVVAPFVPNVLVAGAGSRTLAVLPERSGLLAFLLVHGAFLAAFAWYLLGSVDDPPDARTALALALAWVALAAAAVALDAVAFALVGPLLAAAWYGHRRFDLGFEALLLVAGAGLVLLVEVVYLSDNAAPGRFNTVFKVYAQVWTLWAVAAGVALAGVLERRPALGDLPGWRRALRAVAVGGFVVVLSLYALFALLAHFRPFVDVWTTRPGAVLGAVVGAVALVGGGYLALARVGRGALTAWPRDHPVLTVLVVALLVFNGGVVATGAATTAPDPTLDAVAFAHDYHPDEAAAIEWFAAKEGQPTIVSAPGRQVYQWQNPVSSLTGIPTVVGWAHEAIYRGPEAYADRARDVDFIYAGDAKTRSVLLREYEVDYIYVGPIERERYDVSLDFGDEPGIREVFTAGRNDRVTVYAVNRSELTD